MWTTFWDMSSGGREKLDWPLIYIEAPEKEAVEVFEKLFDRDPYNVTCDCCGEDYSIDESTSLEQASGYHRGCAHEGGKWVEKADKTETYRKYITLAQYEASGKCRIVRRSEFPD